MNLDMKDVSIQTVLKAIEDQSEFFFLYSSKMIDVNQKVDINIEGRKINEVLDDLLAKQILNILLRTGRSYWLIRRQKNLLFTAKQSKRYCYRKDGPAARG